jgi:hypothetical protein
MRVSLLSGLAATAAAAALLSGCGQDHTSAAAAPAAPAVTAGTTAPTATPVLAAPAVAVRQNWPAGPVSVTHHPAVPPVPIVTGVRYAGHPESGYDRIVFDIRGGLPGYTVKYVSKVVADGSGRPIPVPGRRFLLIVFQPAQAHTDAGVATVSGTHPIDLPMLKAYAVAGDYEGYVSIALGLDATTGFRVGELSNRIYVDVAT